MEFPPSRLISWKGTTAAVSNASLEFLHQRPGIQSTTWIPGIIENCDGDLGLQCTQLDRSLMGFLCSTLSWSNLKCFTTLCECAFKAKWHLVSEVSLLLELCITMGTVTVLQFTNDFHSASFLDAALHKVTLTANVDWLNSYSNSYIWRSQDLHKCKQVKIKSGHIGIVFWNTVCQHGLKPLPTPHFRKLHLAQIHFWLLGQHPGELFTIPLDSN